MAYLAESQALAALEMLVHIESVALMPRYVTIGIDIPDGLVADLSTLESASDLNLSVPGTPAVVGSQWARSLSSAVLRVPSFVVPAEFNYLVNPQHDAVDEIRVGEPRAFSFDPRLIR